MFFLGSSGTVVEDDQVPEPDNVAEQRCLVEEVKLKRYSTTPTRIYL